MKQIYRSAIALAALLVILGYGLPEKAEATHFRFGLIQCTPTGTPGQVECLVRQAWRRTFFGSPAVGSTVNTGTWQWGDGTFDNLDVVVTQISVSQDWFIGEATFTHTYSSPGAFSVGWSGCCRISTLRNRPDGSYEVFASVRPFSDNSTPRSSIAPIVGVPQSTTPGTPVTFNIPVSDPEGDGMRCRLSTDAEAGGGPSPTGFSVSNSCVASWDNAGLAQGLYTVQVIVEELANGQVVQSIPIDFIMDLGVQGTNNAPVCSITPAGPITVQAGDPVSFTVIASDPDAGQSIEISGVSIPTFGSMAPGVPLSGASPLSTTFSGTTTAANLGTHFATFSVADDQGARSQCDVRIDVVNQGQPTDTTPPVCKIQAVNMGPPTTLDIFIEDPESGVASITVLKDKNASVAVPAFTPGETNPLMVTATKIDQNQRASVVLQVEDVAGNITKCDPVLTKLSADLPENFQLQQNYPNPFNPTTTIGFSLPEAGHVLLEVYDVAGRKVATLVDGTLEAGTFTAEWDGRTESGAFAAGGTYVYRLKAGVFETTRVMMLLK